MKTDLKFRVLHLEDIASTPCPCGTTRRAFVDDPDQIASLHVIQTDGEARTHYHKRLTEIYYILEGEGLMELDGELFAVRPGSTVLIKPGCRHRAIGKLLFINVPVPAFDPEDEWFD
jgi:mannose-6-phosphate isomerase-like protein (cupin superfamily)